MFGHIEICETEYVSFMIHKSLFKFDDKYRLESIGYIEWKIGIALQNVKLDVSSMIYLFGNNNKNNKIGLDKG